MQCETCGKDVKTGKKVLLEGSIVFTCEECARYGKVINEVAPRETVRKPVVNKPVEAAITPEETVGLVEEFHAVIKRAREKMGWKQEDLAKRINEPISLIHRLEAEEHYEPSDGIIKKLEKTLHVKLVEKKGFSLESMKGGLGRNAKDLTLGDVVVVKKKK